MVGKMPITTGVDKKLLTGVKIEVRVAGAPQVAVAEAQCRVAKLRIKGRVKENHAWTACRQGCNKSAGRSGGNPSRSCLPPEALLKYSVCYDHHRS
jgi:hypothetical protein